MAKPGCFREREIALSKEVAMDMASNAAVLADPTQIHQVLVNLCTNAAHAMSDNGGVLEVSPADLRLGPESIPSHSGLEPGAYVSLTVKDTGNGIAPAILERIFDLFFTTKGQGGPDWDWRSFTGS